MRWSALFALCAAAIALISPGIGGLLQAQAPADPQSPTTLVEGHMPPRAAPSDYPAHVQVGKFTIAADFTGHTVGTQDGLLHTEEYVAIEAGVFGPPGARLMLSVGDFSIRINGKKPLPREPYELVGKSLKDPDYEQPAQGGTGKTILTGTGKQEPGTDPNAPPPIPIPIPFEVKRGWELRVKRDSMPIGDRALPEAGLIFFPYSGGAKGIRSIELIYNGPAGKATLPLHP